MAFPNATTGWAIGTDVTGQRGIVLKYSEGAWAVETLPDLDSNNWTLSALAFTSADAGWIIGYDNQHQAMLFLKYDAAT